MRSTRKVAAERCCASAPKLNGINLAAAAGAECRPRDLDLGRRLNRPQSPWRRRCVSRIGAPRCKRPATSANPARFLGLA